MKDDVNIWFMNMLHSEKRIVIATDYTKKPNSWLIALEAGLILVGWPIVGS